MLWLMTMSKGSVRRDTRSASNQRFYGRLDGRSTPHTNESAVARGRVRWLRRYLDALGERPSNMVTLGWDHGSTTSEFFASLHIRTLTTIDVSRERSFARELRSA